MLTVPPANAAMLTTTERQSFSNYFWTAQLIGGGVMASHVFSGGLGFGEKVLFAIGGFLVVLPFTALAAWLKVRWERTHPPDPNPRNPSRRFIAISVAITVTALALGFWYDRYG